MRPSRGQASFAPLDSIRWVMTGAGIRDAEYLYALEKRAPRTPDVQALLDRARTLATHFPAAWNPSCGAGGTEGDWGDDGYEVEGGAGAPDGSSAYNTWRLAMGAALDDDGAT